MDLTSQERFDKAVADVIKHEGGFIDDKRDPGGATNYGISLRFLKECGIDITKDGEIDVEDIKELAFSDAVDIYKKYFWDKYGYESITYPDVAAKIFDMSVNLGPKQSHKIVQEVCNLFCASIVVDGILGNESIEAINRITSEEGTHRCVTPKDDFIDEMILEQKMFYKQLIAKHPNLEPFLKGWMNRANYTGA